MIFDNVKKEISFYLHSLSREIIDTDSGKLKSCPNAVIWLSFFMSISNITQITAEIIIETLVFSSILDIYLPFRLEFLLLAVISTLLANFTLNGLRKRELDVTQNSTILHVLIEMSLIVSDIYFLLTFEGSDLRLALIRSPFLILTSINVLFIAYIAFRLDLFKVRTLVTKS